MLNNFKRKNIKTIAYVALISVMVIWGVSPILTNVLYERNSASITTFATTIMSVIALFIMAIPHLKDFNKACLKVAIPTGLFNSVAAVLQKIGLQYTTPTQYQFLENLSCVVVPILLLILIRKKPSALVLVASAMCLLSSFILTGMLNTGFSMGIGQILCALAGVFYGFNIAATGVYAKKLNAVIYVFIQMCVQVVVSLITVLALHFIKGADGQPIESIQFSWRFADLAIIVISGVFISAFCWIVRTKVMKHVSPTAVAIIMPFSAVVTGIVSVILGEDPLSTNLILGAFLGLIAAILSGIGDTVDEKQRKQKLLLEKEKQEANEKQATEAKKETKA